MMNYLKEKNIPYRKYIEYFERLDGSDSKFVNDFYLEKIR